jgi:hypothetical protein
MSSSVLRPQYASVTKIMAPAMDKHTPKFVVWANVPHLGLVSTHLRAVDEDHSAAVAAVA